MDLRKVAENRLFEKMINGSIGPLLVLSDAQITVQRIWNYDKLCRKYRKWIVESLKVDKSL